MDILSQCIKKSNISDFIYSLLLLLISLKVFNFYLLNNINTLNLTLLTAIVGFLYVRKCRIPWIYVPTLYLFVTYFLFNVVKSYSLGAMLPVLVYIPILLVSANRKISLYKIFTDILSILFLVSLIFWILYLTGVSLNYTEIEIDGRLIKDYGFFLRNHELVPRFQSLFIEPGHLGTVTALLLYIDKYNLKSFKNVIFLLASIFSLSLASYILIVIGYLIKILVATDTKKTDILLYLFLFCFFITSLAIISYENHDSILYQKVFSRLEFSNGQMSGNNRYSGQFEDYYRIKMQSLDIKLLGMGEDFIFNDFPGNAGYKIYFIVNGLISGLILFFMYFSLTVTGNSLYGYGYLLLNILTFLQRAYAHTYLLVILYILAIPYMSSISTKYKQT